MNIINWIKNKFKKDKEEINIVSGTWYAELILYLYNDYAYNTKSIYFYKALNDENDNPREYWEEFIEYFDRYKNNRKHNELYYFSTEDKHLNIISYSCIPLNEIKMYQINKKLLHYHMHSIYGM